MKFKKLHMAEQFNTLPWVVRHVVKTGDEHAQLLFNKEFIVTRVTDKVDGESGVHTDKRAVDVRTKGHFTAEECQTLVNFLNARFPRKDRFKTCIYHKGTEWHLHIQAPKEVTSYL